MTGYSSNVNGKNQAKLKEKFRVDHDEEDLRRDEDVRHREVVARRSKEEADEKPVSGLPQRRSSLPQ